MSYYLFGSKLINKLVNDKFRPSRDTDYVTNDINVYNVIKSSVATTNVEVYYIPCLPSRELTLDEMYTLKCSHALRDINWQKTMSDIRFFQIRTDVTLDQYLYNDLKQFWNEQFKPQVRTDFEGKTLDNFFKDKVVRLTDHDTLHQMLVSPNEPAYKKVVHEVTPQPKLFFELTLNEQLNVLVEEALVISIERYYKTVGGIRGYILAQKDLITRLHPEWLAEFAIQNWRHIYAYKQQNIFYNNFIKNEIWKRN